MTTLHASAQQQLRQLVEGIERLEEEKAATAADIRDKYAEAKAFGFDSKIIRQVVKLRRQDPHERQEAAALLDTYLHALGMLDGTPLGDWAKELAEKEQAADNLSRMAREDGAQAEPTISIDGGPPHPMSVVREAIGIVKRAKGSGATA